MSVMPAILEIAVVGLGLVLIVLDLWTPHEQRQRLVIMAAFALAMILGASFWLQPAPPTYAFGTVYVLDGLALFFKRLFLLAAILVLLLSREWAARLEGGLVEYGGLILFALAGMMFAASANDFSLLFVAIELISVSFYILVAFQRSHRASLEAGVKYLILGGLASALLVYGIALVFASAGTLAFDQPGMRAAAAKVSPVFLLGLALVLAGLGFKISAVPFQVWTPDIYQGGPTPTTAFLAIGSKAAGIVLLLRVLFGVVPEVTLAWRPLLMVIAGLSIIYGSLCAIPQRNLKRLLGYSSIAHAGYLLLGVAVINAAGLAAVLFYLGSYLFAVAAAFTVIGLVGRESEAEDLDALGGLHQRSPLLAATLALAMMSLAGLPPLAGFFGKFLILKAVLQAGGQQGAYYYLLAIALAGVVVSLYYYLGVVRAIYWSRPTVEHQSPLPVSRLIRCSLYGCLAGMLYLGLFPGSLLAAAVEAVKVFAFK